MGLQRGVIVHGFSSLGIKPDKRWCFFAIFYVCNKSRYTIVKVFSTKGKQNFITTTFTSITMLDRTDTVVMTQRLQSKKFLTILSCNVDKDVNLQQLT